MESIKLPPRSAFAVILLALITLAVWPASAVAAVSCDQILKNAEKTGKPPTVTHIVDWGIIKMTSALGSCREPIEVWRARRITWIKVTKGTKAAPKITTPRITPPKTPKAGAPVPPPKPAEPAEPAPTPEGEPCSLRLKNFWRQTTVNVRGVTYYLSQVFTIDQDDDGVTDNLGFTLKARNKPDMVIRYFASPGQISGRDLPEIEIGNDQLVARFCFGRADFGNPPEEVVAAADSGESFKLPDLAKQMERKKAGLPLDEPPPAPEQEQEKGKPFGLKFWIITVASSFLFIIVIAVIVIVTKPKWEHMLKHDDEDDDDDGNDEDEEE